MPREVGFDPFLAPLNPEGRLSVKPISCTESESEFLLQADPHRSAMKTPRFCPIRLVRSRVCSSIWLGSKTRVESLFWKLSSMCSTPKLIIWPAAAIVFASRATVPM